MLTFKYNKGIFKITERIGRKDSISKNISSTDILLEMELLISSKEADNFIKYKNSLCLLLPNYIINLKISEEDIFKKINKSTRRNIKKSITSNDLIYTELIQPTNGEIMIFSNFYNKFAKDVNIKKCDVNKLISIRDQGALIISYITDDTNEILCSHAHLCNGHQTFGMYSAIKRHPVDNSVNRQLIGRANKYLDWRNIQNAKNRGCYWYNFGGKIMDPQDVKGQNVNLYKKSFGTETGYDLRVYTSKSIFGRVFLFLLHYYFKKKRKYEYRSTSTILNKKFIFFPITYELFQLCRMGGEIVSEKIPSF